MLRIRFQRKGRRNSPFFRIVVTEHSSPIGGKFKEIIGHFNPKTKELSLKNERIIHWVSVGAQPTDRVARLCVKNGISECEKFISERLMKPSKAEERAKQKAEEEAKIKAEEATKAKEEKEAKAQAAAEAKAQAEAEEVVAEEEVKAEETAEAPAEEAEESKE